MDIQASQASSVGIERPAAAPAVGASEPYPSRAVRLIVGFPAEGPLDIAPRTLAPFLSRRFGQEFVVENSPGRRQHRMSVG